MLGATVAVCGFGCPLCDPDQVDLVVYALLCVPGGMAALG
jgi:hypothetical protein